MADLRNAFAFPVLALTALVFAGCGGSSAVSDLVSDGGSEATAALEAAVDAPSGSSGFNPGAIGSLVGGALPPDAGMMAATAAEAGATAIAPKVVSGCAELCSKEQAASCPGFGAASSCAVGCELVLRNPACATAAESLFSCVSTATASCDSSGNPTFASCPVQEIGAEACFLTTVTDTSLQPACTTYCADVAAAKCPNDNPNGCVAGCEALGNLFGCDAAWTQYVTCANGSTLSCGSDGKAGATACIAQAASFWECAAGGLVAATADGG